MSLWLRYGGHWTSFCHCYMLFHGNYYIASGGEIVLNFMVLTAGKTNSVSISHFQVNMCLCFKTSLPAFWKETSRWYIFSYEWFARRLVVTQVKRQLREMAYSSFFLTLKKTLKIFGFFFSNLNLPQKLFLTCLFQYLFLLKRKQNHLSHKHSLRA